jgi:hypothetical protein
VFLEDLGDEEYFYPSILEQSAQIQLLKFGEYKKI